MCELALIRDAFKDDLVYVCSRCGGCYVCEHLFYWAGSKWKVICQRDKKGREVIRDEGVTEYKPL